MWCSSLIFAIKPVFFLLVRAIRQRGSRPERWRWEFSAVEIPSGCAGEALGRPHPGGWERCAPGYATSDPAVRNSERPRLGGRRRWPETTKDHCAAWRKQFRALAGFFPKVLRW